MCLAARIKKGIAAILFGTVAASWAGPAGAAIQRLESRAPMRVTQTPSGVAIFDHGKIFHAPALQQQVGISDAQVSGDGRTAGWLAMFKNPDSGQSYAGALVIWRAGKVVRIFRTNQSIYSWTFNREVTQVAYHTGPLHGERSSQCELRDVATGRLIDRWNGEITDVSRPSWALNLKR